MNFAEEMESQFGSDEALGVTFSVMSSDAAIADMVLSVSEFEKMQTELGDAMPDCQSFFPDGSSAVCCTDYARQISQKLPGRVQIFGFANEDNPTSRVALEELHPGGHDFAVVDDRYVVDPWVRLVLCEKGSIVFDMHDQDGAAEILRTYGPQSCWTRMDQSTQSFPERPIG